MIESSATMNRPRRAAYQLHSVPHINAMQGTPTPYQPSVVPVMALPSSNVPKWLKGRP